ncbi:hypothetical protein D9M70_560340 [compost metagenome]
MRAVGDHLVAVHVRLRTGARLPYHQRELVVQLSLQDFPAYLADQPALFFVKHAGVEVGQRCTVLKIGKRPDDLLRHFIDILSYFKVFNGALCLSAPIHVSGHLHLTHRVFFYSEFHSLVLFIDIMQIYWSKR